MQLLSSHPLPRNLWHRGPPRRTMIWRKATTMKLMEMAKTKKIEAMNKKKMPVKRRTMTCTTKNKNGNGRRLWKNWRKLIQKKMLSSIVWNWRLHGPMKIVFWDYWKIISKAWKQYGVKQMVVPRRLQLFHCISKVEKPERF
mmetsp:Transcript_15450/g.44659  ORF Transcript_15450/g.44659 Transcript_15450/m.44659 type:complete len:142 (-) Transcript_15450:673-1098(-)